MKTNKMINKLQKLGNKIRGTTDITKKQYNKLIEELNYIKTSIVQPMYFRTKKGN